MAISIDESQVYQSGSGGYATTHTLPDLDCSGSDSYAIACGFNRNPASDVSSWTFEGATPDNVDEHIVTNVAACSIKGDVVSDADLTIVSNTPSYKLQAMIGVALSGVDQTTPVAGTDSKEEYTSSISLSYTGTSGNMLLVFVGVQNDVTFTATNCTEITSVTHADSNLGSGFVGYVTATGSAQSVGASWSGSMVATMVVVELTAAASGTAYTQDLEDTSSSSEDLVLAATRPIADSVTNVVSQIKDALKSLEDTNSTTEEVSASATRSLTDSITNVVVFVKQSIRSLVDTISTSEILSKIYSGVRSYTDSAATSDSNAVDTSKIINDSSSGSDSIQTTQTALKDLSDSVVASASLLLDTVKSLSDSLGLSEVLARVGTFLRSLTDSLGTSENLTSSSAATADLEDTVSVGGGSGGNIALVDSMYQAVFSPIASLPTNAVEGNFMIAFVETPIDDYVWRDDGGGGNGWVLLDQNQYSPYNLSSAIYYKFHDGSESNPSFNVYNTSNNNNVGTTKVHAIMAFDGVDPTTPFDVTFNNTDHYTEGLDDPTPINSPITTVTDNSVVILLHNTRVTTSGDRITASGMPTGYTASYTPSTYANVHNSFGAYREVTSAGTETPTAWTHTAANQNADYQTYTLALRPASSGGSGGDTILFDVSKSLAEALSGVTEAFAKVGTFIRSLSDGASVSEAFDAVIGSIQSLSDSVSVSESFTKAATYIKALTDSISHSESMVKVATLLKSLTDSVSAIGSKLIEILRSLTDSVGTSEDFTGESSTGTGGGWGSGVWGAYHYGHQRVPLTYNYISFFEDTQSLEDEIDSLVDRLFEDEASSAESISYIISKGISDIISIVESIITQGIFVYTKLFSETIIAVERLVRYLNGVRIIWDKLPRKITSWVDKARKNTSWTDKARKDTTYTGKARKETSWTDKARKSTIWNKLSRK